MIVVCFVAYIASIRLSPEPALPRDLYNNFFFLIVTSSFVLAGSYFYERLRYREFALRKQVEDSRALLEEQNHQLSELDEAKTRFFANISHELRTPLTVIIGLNERLQQHFRKGSDEEVAEGGRNLSVALLVLGVVSFLSFCAAPSETWPARKIHTPPTWGRA